MPRVLGGSQGVPRGEGVVSWAVQGYLARNKMPLGTLHADFCLKTMDLCWKGTLLHADFCLKDKDLCLQAQLDCLMRHICHRRFRKRKQDPGSVSLFPSPVIHCRHWA